MAKRMSEGIRSRQAMSKHRGIAGRRERRILGHRARGAKTARERQVVVDSRYDAPCPEHDIDRGFARRLDMARSEVHGVRRAAVLHEPGDVIERLATVWTRGLSNLPFIDGKGHPDTVAESGPVH
jgi:hypothetical protein